jgi:hypothetical protein
MRQKGCQYPIENSFTKPGARGIKIQPGLEVEDRNSTVYTFRTGASIA